MSESRTVLTSESMMQQLTGTPPAREPKTPEPAGDDGKTGAAAAADASQASKKKPLVEELVRTRHERNEARTEAEQLRADLAELRQQMQDAQVQPIQRDPDPKPERAKFVSDEDYFEALADWKADQKFSEREQEQQQARANAAQERLVENWNRRLDLAKGVDLQDFDDVVGKSEVDMPNHLYFAIVESDVGPQLAYYFAKNPDEARLLKGMSPTAALRTLGKIEDRLLAEQATETVSEKTGKKDSAPAAAASVQKPVEVSKAPAPIEPLKDANSPVEKPRAQMTYAEYKAARQKELAARRR